MLTIAFLICLPNGMCMSNSPNITFQTQDECAFVAEQIIETNRNAVARGEAPPHVAYYQCVEWGEPA